MKDRLAKASEAAAKRDAKKKEDTKKICPFMTSVAGVIYCSEKCALYRHGKQKGFECPFTEMTSMSWYIKGQPGRK